MHLISLSFDDGLSRSFAKTARIHEKFGLKACLNVLAGEPKWVASTADYQMTETVGDFDLWNQLQARGHEIMPHGLHHINKASIPLEQAQDLILRCLDVFDERLKGFDRKTAVFNFPYNASTPPLNQWQVTQVRAARAGEAPLGLNPLPIRETRLIGTTSFGPGNADAHVEQCVQNLLAKPEGWLVYGLHALDGEAWGPISSDYLERLLARLVEIPGVKILPVAKVLEQVDAGTL